MAYTRMTAAEAAALIKNGDHIAMSGFTPAGVAKSWPRVQSGYLHRRFYRTEHRW